jgi:hypothetical protein
VALHARRIGVAAMMEGAVILLAYIYATVGQPVFDLVEEHPGPFSSTVESIDTLMPFLILLLALGIIVWMLAAPVQQERNLRRIR